MDGNRFDVLTQAFGTAGTRRTERRRLVVALLGLASATVGLGIARPPAEGVAKTAASRACRRGKRRCDGRCVDTDTSDNHCGRCNKRCKGDKRCRGGRCAPPCETVLRKAGCMLVQGGGWYCPPGTNLSGANLGTCNLLNAALNGVTLAGADLSDANLRDVDFVNANLSGADLGGADLTFVAWGNTTCPDGANSGALGNPTCCGHLNGAQPKAGC